MKTRARLLAAMIGLAAMYGFAYGQPVSSASDNAGKTAKVTANFAAKEKQMQDESRSSAFGPLPLSTTTAKPLNKNKDAGKGMLEAEAKLQTSPTRGLGSPKVDTTAKNADPMKNISKMSTGEKDQLLREVQKEAKP